MTSLPRTDIDFEALFDAAPGIYLVLDAQFNMVAANEARLKATMSTREDVLGRYLFDLFPDNPDDPAADGVRNLRISLERVLQTRQPDAMAVQKYDIPRPEAQGGGFEVRYWSPLNTPVLGNDGEVKYIIHRVEDVTEFMALKSQEAALQSHADRIENEIYHRAKEVQEANRKFEAANAELARLYNETQELAAGQQRFFSQVSHELRTPLTLILGPVEALLAARSALSSDQVRGLEVIARNARTLLRHVNDLLDVVKYKSGAMGVLYSRSDLAERLRVAAAHFDSASTGLAVTVDLIAPPHLEAEIDVEKIDRILINLLSNAFKFSPSEGRIQCTLGAVEECAAITIADDGPGVAPALREAIFEPFRQGDEGLTRRASGTGLGLAIVRDFVALHGGSIWVRDAESGGALFEVRLPLRAPKGAQVGEAAPGIEDWNFRQAVETRRIAEQPPSTAVSAAAALVLIVEDNADMAQFVAQALMSTCRIATARDGREGLAQAERIQPDLIVSDLMMPGMSGDQLIAALAERPTLRDIPVLLLTARADEETRIEALRQGAQDFLAKPFSVDELRARVDNLIRVKQTADLIKRGKRVSEEKYRQLMDGARDGVFILSATGVILDANRRAEEFCGCSGASLIGTHFTEAFEGRNTRDAELDLDANTVFRIETDDANDEHRFFEGSIAAVEIDLEAYRLVIVRETTEQRKLEAQLRRVQKLDALGQLTGGIAHDFNNLLGAVALSTEALQNRLAEGSDAKRIAATLEKAIERGRAMTSRLLAFARQQPVVSRECDVNEIVLGSIDLIRTTLSTNIEIATDLGGELGPVRIDPAQLEDALLNLAINARDAMPNGGQLIIATALTRIEFGAIAAPAGDYVLVRVADTGAGMTLETQSRVFEPFFTTKEEGKGTGLGLSMVYGFARQAGGDVRIVSALGEGTSVEVLLPSLAVIEERRHA